MSLLYSLLPQGIKVDNSPTGVRISSFPTGLGLTDLDRSVQSLALAGLSTSTSSCYSSGVRRYLNFICLYNTTSFPLTEAILCRFVAFLAGEGLSYSAIRQYLSALQHHQLLSTRVDPAFASFHCLHYVLRGSRRSLRLSLHPNRLPITPGILRAL